jgi:hypothetical protein
MAEADDPLVLLQFEAPGPAGMAWAAAEKEALKFPARFLKQARELLECRRELQRAWDDNQALQDKLVGFVLRNLIAVADTCRLGLTEAAAAEAPAGPAAAALASVERSVLYVLEELGARRVDLLGQTYDGVTVEGQKVEDPFEVLGSDRKGRLSEVAVREVVGALWVRVAGGAVEVLQKGKVNC